MCGVGNHDDSPTVHAPSTPSRQRNMPVGTLNALLSTSGRHGLHSESLATSSRHVPQNWNNHVHIARVRAVSTSTTSSTIQCQPHKERWQGADEANRWMHPSTIQPKGVQGRCVNKKCALITIMSSAPLIMRRVHHHNASKLHVQLNYHTGTSNEKLATSARQ